MSETRFLCWDPVTKNNSRERAFLIEDADDIESAAVAAAEVWWNDFDWPRKGSGAYQVHVVEANSATDHQPHVVDVRPYSHTEPGWEVDGVKEPTT